jgi:L-rhamnose isomerase
LDNGHFHPTENAADKISAYSLFFDIIPFHITRPVRWDSDHVTLFNDELRELLLEITHDDVLPKAKIGLDFFDASINRVAAWIIGTRAVQKALLYALLTPPQLRELQNTGDFTQLMAMREDIKLLPFGDVWDEYLNRQSTPEQWFDDIKKYEETVLFKRV